MTCTLGTTIPEADGTIIANGVDVTEVWTNHAGVLQQVWRKRNGPVAASWSFHMEDQFIDDVECNGENSSVNNFQMYTNGVEEAYSCLSYNGCTVMRVPTPSETGTNTLTLNMGAANAGCSVELRTWWTADWLDKFDAVIVKGSEVQDFGNGIANSFTGVVDANGNFSFVFSMEDNTQLYPKNTGIYYPDPSKPLTKNGSVVARTADENYPAHCYFHIQFFLTRDGVTKASNEWVGDNQVSTVTFSIS